ncbi:class I SAM-dependent methyltransferase [Noviherbaspirillum cavernae]|uniref:Class I SAM-dependent methyltransferase n=1 Tax=Noviherbaspirillum cavernae TaxID=2320862 RepID=A0A418X1X7_9BURK|nr:class I SAM-dependent methyltransferase [Noviherbaspirillum cavernae]RJG06457.1 class I SAM-dependent methyltransferase [Noviherbaspirillum cavernae]
MHAAFDQPSAWVVRFASLIPEGEVLDLACGSGRHARFLAARGYRVLAVDRDSAALERAAADGVRTLPVDLEDDSNGSASWPFEADRFNGIVVTNYLHRPLLPRILYSLAPGGILIYETFTCGNERYGKPSNPDFLLTHGELLRLTEIQCVPSLRIIAFEDGYVDFPKPAMVQRICVLKGRGEGDENPSSLHLN